MQSHHKINVLGGGQIGGYGGKAAGCRRIGGYGSKAAGCSCRGLWRLSVDGRFGVMDGVAGARCSLGVHWATWLTGYLALTLVFIWSGAQQEKSNFCF